MKNRFFPLRSAFQHAFRETAKVSSEARRAGLVAIACLATLAVGVVGLAQNALVREVLRISAHRAAGFFLWWPAQSVHAQGTGGPTFTVFDAPGAGTGMFQGTMGTSINDSGDIAGVYLTAPSTTVPNLAHGFVRSAATGSITAFDAPNSGAGKNQGTFPASINTTGDIAGMYFDAGNAYHGFVRSAAGTITEFDVPGAPTTIGHRGTLPISMNAGGDIAGFYVDANDMRHGFVRAVSSTFTTFDAPGAGTGLKQGTVPFNIDAVGDITGFYVAANGTFHGFLRASNGTITAPIDAPGAGTGPSGKLSFMGTLPLAFDSAGDIAGIYADATGVNHGFVRSAAGTFTTFDVPGAGTTGLFTETDPASMNAGGDISGIYTDTSGVHHGFVRAANGTFTAPLDAPNAAMTGMFSATVLISINATDQITGTFEDTSGVFHGFLLTLGPPPPPPAATPTFSPPAATYTSAQMVTISDMTPGATIYYAINATPTASSTKFTTPISVSTSETINAIAAASGFSNSAVASATYTINAPPPAATPMFSPAPGNYTSQQMVTISDTTAGATIYFTTDGSTPTTSSTKFTSPIPVSSAETIKAIAVATGFSNSAVGSATYTFNADFQVSVNPTTLNIARGQSGTATFTVTPQNGFSTAVSFSCSGLPAEAACSFSPASVTPNGAAATSTLTVTTTAKSAALRLPSSGFHRFTYASLLPVLAMIFGIAAGRRRELRRLRLLGLFILLLFATKLNSCNGGSAGGGNPGTPLGSSTVSVSASSSGSGGVSHSASLMITITQ